MTNIRCVGCSGDHFLVIGTAVVVKRHWWGVWPHRAGLTLGCVVCGARQTVTKDEVYLPGGAKPSANGPITARRAAASSPDPDMNWNPDRMP